MGWVYRDDNGNSYSMPMALSTYNDNTTWTMTNTTLREFARDPKNQPPQEWWDEDDAEFVKARRGAMADILMKYQDRLTDREREYRAQQIASAAKFRDRLRSAGILLAAAAWGVAWYAFARAV